MVNTFIMDQNLVLSASLLDNKRLGKQRVETRQIIDILEEIDRGSTTVNKGFINHPAVKAWIGYTNQLKVYFNIIVREWCFRGFKNNMDFYSIDENLYHIVPCNFIGNKAYYDVTKFNKYSFPFWVNYPPFYLSHQASLCRKNPVYYSKFLREELKPFLNNGYLWPTKITKECLDNWNFSYHDDLSSGCPPVYRILPPKILKWIVNPHINPNTRRIITEKSIIYKDYLEAMNGHKIAVSEGNIYIDGSILCRIDEIDMGILILEQSYMSFGDNMGIDRLVYKFANLKY
jgi:hypothetical protein